MAANSLRAASNRIGNGIRRGRHEEEGAALSRSFRANNGRELLSYKFIDDKMKAFIRKCIIKDYLKNLKLPCQNCPLELTQSLHSVKRMKWSSNKAASGYRKFLAEFPDFVETISKFFVNKANWPDKLCKLLKISYAGHQEQKDSICKHLIRLIIIYIKKGVKSRKNAGISITNANESDEDDLDELILEKENDLVHENLFSQDIPEEELKPKLGFNEKGDFDKGVFVDLSTEKMDLSSFDDISNFSGMDNFLHLESERKQPPTSPLYQRS